MAIVLAPIPPIEDWLAELERALRDSHGFLSGRPVVLNLSALEAHGGQAAAILNAPAIRALRVISIEGLDPALVPSGLAPLAGGMEAPVDDRSDRLRGSVRPPASRVIDVPVRSGQSIFFPEGDLTILGAVSSGAEVIAGGSIHVHGALRGRAMAGTNGNQDARIFCRKFEAELVAIDGCYLTAEEWVPEVIGQPAQVWRKDNTLSVERF